MTPAPLSTYPTSQTWLSQFSRSDADRATAAALLDAMLLLNEEQISAAEVATWRSGSTFAFCQTMREAGAEPVAIIHNVRVWKRADVEQVFPESLRSEFWAF